MTPVYNGERYLGECIESVLSQGLTDFEYVIVDNCSSDRTAAIAEQYAKDPRIRVHRNPEVLPVIANYNRGAALISPDARYLKYLAADDLLLPDCLQHMVDIAEANPSVELVASYKIHGTTTICEGPPVTQDVVDGREICRSFFRGRLGVIGGPTNHLIRVPTRWAGGHPFDEDFLHADIELFVRLLKGGASYGFVHQVLTFSREHDESLSSSFAHVMGTGDVENLAILERYGPSFLTEGEHLKLVKSHRRTYARFLVRALLKPWERRIWRYQVAAREKLNVHIGPMDLFEAAAMEAAATVLSPAESVRRLRRELARLTRSR